MDSVSVQVILSILVYLGICLLIPLYFRNKASKGYLEFVIAGKELPWWVITGTSLGTMAAASTFLGWPGLAWQFGWSAGWQVYLNVISVMLMAILLVPLLAKMKRVTLAEPLGERFSSKVRTVASLLSLVRLMGAGAIAISGVGTVISLFTPLSWEVAMVIALLVILIYSWTGGQYAIAYSDVLSSILVVLALIIAPVALLLSIGNGSVIEGWNVIRTTVPETHFDWLGQPDRITIFGWITVWLFSQFMRPEQYQRVYAARTTKDGVVGWVLASYIAIIALTGSIIGGLASRVLIQDIAVRDQVFPAALKMAAPGWVSVVYALGICAAVMSTANSVFMSASATFMTDFYLPLSKKDISEEKMVKNSRVALLVFSVISLLWAIYWKSIIRITNDTYTLIISGLLFPFWAMFFWPRITTAGAMASLVVGAGLAAVWQWGTPLIPGVPAILPSLLLSIVVGVAISLLTKPEYQKALNFARVYKIKNLEKNTLKCMQPEKV